MVQQYFDMLVDFCIATYYYQFYSVRAKRRKYAVNAACILSSSAFVVSWYQSSKYHLLWALLIVSCQIISSLQPLFPYEKQYNAACYIYQDVNRLMLDAEFVWLDFMIDTPADSDVKQHILDFRNRYSQIEDRFAKPGMFPVNKRLHNEAQKNAEIYLRRYQR
jgi:hypothetical protein